jgi:hypothetical protein
VLLMISNYFKVPKPVVVCASSKHVLYGN